MKLTFAVMPISLRDTLLSHPNSNTFDALPFLSLNLSPFCRLPRLHLKQQMPCFTPRMPHSQPPARHYRQRIPRLYGRPPARSHCHTFPLSHCQTVAQLPSAPLTLSLPILFKSRVGLRQSIALAYSRVVFWTRPVCPRFHYCVETGRGASSQ